jgi:hypothetical protein
VKQEEVEEGAKGKGSEKGTSIQKRMEDRICKIW